MVGEAPRWPVATLVAIFLLRDRSYGTSGLRQGILILPGVLGMFIALGMLLVIRHLTADREDGTLLRAEATPNGIRGYLIGKLVTLSATILAYLAILLVPVLLIVDGLDIGSIGSWLTMGWVLLLGLVATQSVGAMLGSLISSLAARVGRSPDSSSRPSCWAGWPVGTRGRGWPNVRRRRRAGSAEASRQRLQRTYSSE